MKPFPLAAPVRKMNLGHRDQTVVYWKAKPPCAGNNAYRHRESGPLGLIDVDNGAVYLPPKTDDNELMLAVAEYFGGWA